MKKITLHFVLILLLISCNSVKNTQRALYSGDYDKAITSSINSLKRNKTKEKNQPYVSTLEDAFKKVKERDEARVLYLENENKPENSAAIYGLYKQLRNRQEKIKPLLPLRNPETGRQAIFSMRNYDNNILAAKENYIAHLYNKAIATYNQGQHNKYNYRTAYQQLLNLDKINPNYKDVRSLINEAHHRGTDFVAVAVKNRTRQIIPRRLEEELLALDTYGLDNLWTVYHSERNNQIKYDYRLELNLAQINISPERIREKEIIREKQIKDGYTYKVNAKGKYVRDEAGNRIKVDKFINARCKVIKFTQFKSSNVVGVVQFIDNYSNRILNEFPIESEFVFEHAFARSRGDRRVLETPLYNLTEQREIPFPSSEQMVYDTGTDLKEKFKYIITRNQFNR